MKTIWPGRSIWHSTGLRLLDLDDHVRPAVDLLGGGDDFGAVADVSVVVQAGAGPGSRLDQHAVSGAGQLLGPDGQQADAIFIVLDFLGNSNKHG